MATQVCSRCKGHKTIVAIGGWGDAHFDPCPICQGTGEVESSTLGPCVSCAGTGKFQTTCPHCGNGVLEQACEVCGGSGLVPKHP